MRGCPSNANTGEHIFVTVLWFLWRETAAVVRKLGLCTECGRKTYHARRELQLLGKRFSVWLWNLSLLFKRFVCTNHINFM